jgi:hypothetical protein
MSGDDMVARVRATVENGRRLAARLAQNATDIADTFDRIARFHESVAEIEGHPLRDHAARSPTASAASQRWNACRRPGWDVSGAANLLSSILRRAERMSTYARASRIRRLVALTHRDAATGCQLVLAESSEGVAGAVPLLCELLASRPCGHTLRREHHLKRDGMVVHLFRVGRHVGRLPLDDVDPPTPFCNHARRSICRMPPARTRRGER